MPLDRLEQYKRVEKDVTSVCRRSFVLPRDSLYGSAMVLPQVTRSLGCHSFYVGKCIVHWGGLYFAMFLQIALVIQVHSILMNQDAECDKDKCSCVAKGFVPLVDLDDFLYGTEIPRFSPTGKRWFLCRAAGSDGHHILRRLCVAAFVIALFKDLRQSVEMFNFLLNVPTDMGNWMVVVTNLEDSLHVKANGHKEIVSNLSSSMVWQVAALESGWKAVYAIFLLIPKLVIFFLVYWMGSLWLMSETDRSELILNAVALVFVLDLDELLFLAIVTSDVQQYMDNLKPWTRSMDEEVQDASAVEDAKDETIEDGDEAKLTREPSARATESWSSIRGLMFCSLNVMFFPLALGFTLTLISSFYESHCYEEVHLSCNSTTPSVLGVA